MADDDDVKLIGLCRSSSKQLLEQGAVVEVPTLGEKHHRHASSSSAIEVARSIGVDFLFDLGIHECFEAVGWDDGHDEHRNHHKRHQNPDTTSNRDHRYAEQQGG